MKIFLKNNKIKEMIARKNKSQNWLAHKLEISSGYLSQLMEGSRNPSPKVREKIMAALPEYQFDDLFSIELDGENGGDSEKQKDLS